MTVRGEQYPPGPGQISVQERIETNRCLILYPHEMLTSDEEERAGMTKEKTTAAIISSSFATTENEDSLVSSHEPPGTTPGVCREVGRFSREYCAPIDCPSTPHMTLVRALSAQSKEIERESLTHAKDHLGQIEISK